jgi:hypothetical protein
MRYQPAFLSLDSRSNRGFLLSAESAVPATATLQAGKKQHLNFGRYLLLDLGFQVDAAATATSPIPDRSTG